MNEYARWIEPPASTSGTSASLALICSRSACRPLSSSNSLPPPSPFTNPIPSPPNQPQSGVRSTPREHILQKPEPHQAKPAQPTATHKTRTITNRSLHLGNARTFLINWALAKQNNWDIILRIEDLAHPDVKPGVIDDIISTLQWLGLTWSGNPIIQSQNLEPYNNALTTLAQNALCFPCALTRTEIEQAATAPHVGEHETHFPQAARPPGAGSTTYTPNPADTDTNHRFITNPQTITFHDKIHGPQSFNPANSVGDFVIWTKRAQPAYQLAVVVDDHRQNVTHIVRGDDLLDSTARQLLIYRSLGYAPEPNYYHLPLVVGTDGRRLAKRHGDTRINQYKKQAIPPEAIVGLLHHLSTQHHNTPNKQPEPMSADDFAKAFSLDTMPTTPVVLTKDAERLHARTTPPGPPTRVRTGKPKHRPPSTDHLEVK